MLRGAYVGRVNPGPFHCLSCQTYVTGTESGHCPRCGFVPPAALPMGDSLQPIRGVTIGVAVLVVIAVLWLALH